MYLRLQLCLSVCLSGCLFAFLAWYAYVYVRLRSVLYVCMYVCMYVRMYVRACMRTFTCARVYLSRKYAASIYMYFYINPQKAVLHTCICMSACLALISNQSFTLFPGTI